MSKYGIASLTLLKKDRILYFDIRNSLFDIRYSLFDVFISISFVDWVEITPDIVGFRCTQPNLHLIWKEQVVESVGAACSRDHFNSRLQAAPTVFPTEFF